MAIGRKPKSSVTIVGTTTWGTTLSLFLANKGYPTYLLTRTLDEAEDLSRDREHRSKVPGHTFPSNLLVTSDPAEALFGTQAILFAVPSEMLRQNARKVSPHVDGSPLIISASKGIEPSTSKRMSTVLGEELPFSVQGRISVLSGPNLASEFLSGSPASAVVASERAVAREAQRLLSSSRFRVYTNTDMVGTELAGALKNVIAIGSGIGAGLGYGDNFKAALVSRGLVEISHLGVALGGKNRTFYGLAGLGDLIATCYSKTSRNHRVGEYLGQGLSLDQALARLSGQVAEGVTTSSVALAMAQTQSVDMPITDVVCRVLFENLNVETAVDILMERPLRSE